MRVTRETMSAFSSAMATIGITRRMTISAKYIAANICTVTTTLHVVFNGQFLDYYLFILFIIKVVHVVPKVKKKKKNNKIKSYIHQRH